MAWSKKSQEALHYNVIITIAILIMTALIVFFIIKHWGDIGNVAFKKVKDVFSFA